MMHPLPPARPIIFSAPMIRALIEGRKSQTRRVLKPQPYPFNHPENGWRSWNASGQVGGRICICDRDLLDLHRKPAPGDRLWVREAWMYARYRADNSEPVPELGALYRADGCYEGLRGWRSPIHMPRRSSRLTLTVTDVRVQRLQDISVLDIGAEGVPLPPADAVPPSTYYQDVMRDGYRALWNSIHGPEAWDANPWVAALTFTVRQGNIDA